MSKDLLKLGHLFAEIASGHDVARFEEIVAPNYVNHNAFAEPGREGVKKVFAAMRGGVPDLKVFAEDVFVSADGSRVVGRYRAFVLVSYAAGADPAAIVRKYMQSPEFAEEIEGWDPSDIVSVESTYLEPTTSSRLPLFWFTLLVPAAIIGLGINFILNPVGASAGFGIPIHDPAAFPFMWIKGIRDIFAGVVVLVFLLRGDLRTTATIYSIAVFIAIGDGFVILSHLGFAPPFFIHWGTALYMIIVAAFLHRKSGSPGVTASARD